ncbi:MAG: hypothetical protein IKL07_08860 [Clostridium sp.]|nr:hypothetical protein [Clostridium sp.]
MMEGLHRFFSRKSNDKHYGYSGEYGDMDETDAEDLFMEESYMNSNYEAEDEYFD